MIEPAVVLSRRLSAPVADVFAAWTQPAILRRWLAPGANVVEHAETDLRVGGHFLLRTRGPDGTRHAISGCYQAIEPNRHILMTWVYEGPLDLLAGEETLLRIDLLPVDDATTDLRIIHHRLCRSDVRQGYQDDWPSCFDKLDRALRQIN